jgi:excisionase family DNA binding protein
MGELPAGDWVTAAEAAAVLGVVKRRVLAIINDGSGRLPAKKVGNALLILRADLDRFAAEPRKPGPRPKAGEAEPQRGEKSAQPGPKPAKRRKKK